MPSRASSSRNAFARCATSRNEAQGARGLTHAESHTGRRRWCIASRGRSTPLEWRGEMACPAGFEPTTSSSGVWTRWAKGLNCRGEKLGEVAGDGGRMPRSHTRVHTRLMLRLPNYFSVAILIAINDVIQVIGTKFPLFSNQNSIRYYLMSSSTDILSNILLKSRTPMNNLEERSSLVVHGFALVALAESLRNLRQSRRF